MSSSGFLPVTSNTRSAMRLMIVGARVVRLVDAVAESHQPALAALDPLDERRARCSIEPISASILQHRLVGAAVQRPVQRRRRAGERRIRIGMRAADAAHRVRAAVLLVVGVQDEEDVERALEHRVRLVPRLGHLEQHVQEVAGEAQLVVRQHVRAADRCGGRRRRRWSAPWRSAGSSAAAATSASKIFLASG